MESNQLRFLESADNLRRLVRLRTGRGLSATRAREIASCIQQGRQFFEAAPASPLEIRPLVQFYGMVGFAKALVLGHRLCSMAALAKGHGLRDISAPDARIVDLTAQVAEHGTFVEFNDTVSALNRICYLDEATHPAKVLVPTATSADLAGQQMTLRDVLARTPGLSKLYQHTFSELPASEPLDHLYFVSRHRYWTTRLLDRERISSRASLRAIVANWRARFPYLSRWTVVDAEPAYGDTYITIANLDRGSDDDMAEDWLHEVEPNHFISPMRDSPPADKPRLAFNEHLLGVGGGHSGTSVCAISPLHGSYVSEFALSYTGLFLLSSLVRYRPDVWTHAVSRSSLQDRPADDQALAIVQSFLEANYTAVPRLIMESLNPHEDRYA